MTTKTKQPKILEPKEQCGCKPPIFHINADNIGVCKKCGSIKRFCSTEEIFVTEKVKHTTGGLPHVIVSEQYGLKRVLRDFGF